MYEPFCGLAEEPFKMTPDPRFLYLSKNHEEGLKQLWYGIQRKKGLLLLTGEIGTGKTTLLNNLIQSLDKKTRVAFLVDSQISPLVMLGKIYHEFGIHMDGKIESDASIEFKNFLMNCLHANEDCILILDEAQNSADEIFEQLRLLLNLETQEEKLLQIILVGHPELHDKLNMDELTKLKQRIDIVYQLLPLNHEETVGYITQRLSIAGATTSPFTDEAIEEVYKYSRGTPRLINNICDTALSIGFSDEQRDIGRICIRQAVEQLGVNAPEAVMDRNIAKTRDRGTTSSGDTHQSRRQKALARLLVMSELPSGSWQAERLGNKTGHLVSRRVVYVGLATGIILGLILAVGSIWRAKPETNVPAILSRSTEHSVAVEHAHTQAAVGPLADTEHAAQAPTSSRLTSQTVLLIPTDDDMIMGYESDFATSNHHRTAQAKENHKSLDNVLPASAPRASQGSPGHRLDPSPPPPKSPEPDGRKAAGSTADPGIQPLASHRENHGSKAPRRNAAREQGALALVYTLQVGSFLEEANAQKIAAELRIKGYHPYIFKKRDTQNRVWHRVFIGRFTDKDHAKAIEIAFKEKENRDAYLRLTEAWSSESGEGGR